MQRGSACDLCRVQRKSAAAVLLTWSRVGDGGCRHGDGNANPAAAAVLPAAAAPAASAEGGEGNKRRKEEKTFLSSAKPARPRIHSGRFVAQSNTGFND